MSDTQDTSRHAPAAASLVTAWVAYSPAPRELRCVPVQLMSSACTVRDALQASGLWASLEASAPVILAAAAGQPAAEASFQADGWHGLRLAVFGAKVELHTCLEEGDRLDVCRPLRVDPKLARRERFSQQGARRSGLFARRRPGGVAGY